MRFLIWLLWAHPRRALVDWALGPRCAICNERRRGPRTLDRHVYLDHAGEAS